MSRIEKLRELLVENQNDCFLQHALALEYIKLQKDAEAQLLFESILEKTPNYVGTYYHLAKLLERGGKAEEAMKIFQKGMEIAKTVKDVHTYNELKSAYDEIAF